MLKDVWERLELHLPAQSSNSNTFEMCAGLTELCEGTRAYGALSLPEVKSEFLVPMSPAMC